MQQADCWHCGAVNTAGLVCATCNSPSAPPRVAVFDVGQGNCNAIIDADGRIQAYYDFGYSTEGDKFPTPPLLPCFCDRPLIILSHWDQDHINLSKHVPECLTSEWLVPQQVHSDFATKLQKRIKNAGGILHTVPYGSPNHMLFPWGYVERASGANTDVNGSGLVAMVCVRNSPTHPAPPVGVGVLPGLHSSLPLAHALRARQAYGQVPAEVVNLVAAPQRAAVELVARPVAVMLAASQTMVAAGRQPRMPVAECVTAAVLAAIEAVVNGANNATVYAAIEHANVLPTLFAYNNTWGREVRHELADATMAVQVIGARGWRVRVRAATACFTHDGKIEDDEFSWVGTRAALAPLPPPPALITGAARFGLDERFILLNGDAEYQYLPSMQQPNRPRIVAMTAMHHGAIYECKTHLTTRNIPYAPGSAAARAVIRFSQARLNNVAGLTTSVVSIATEAGLALQHRRRKDRRRVLRANVTRVASAAAAAVYAVQLRYPNQMNAKPRKFAAAAAAAAVAAWREADARVVGLATLLATTTESTASKTDTSPIETVVEVAVRGIAGKLQSRARLSEICAGSLDGDLIPHVHKIARAMRTAGTQALTPANAGAEAASALGELWGCYKEGLVSKKAATFKRRIDLNNKHVHLMNDLATGAVAAILATAPKKKQAKNGPREAGVAVGVAPGQLANLSTLVSTILQSDYGAAPAGVNGIALLAARLAAERVAAYLVGCTVEAVRAVIAAAGDPVQYNDARRAIDRQAAQGVGGHIAYSYGVGQTDYGHAYRDQTISAARCGHPHPLAVIKYESHGWIWRMNASSRSRHKGEQGDADRQHSYGHVSLSWDSVNDSSPRMGQSIYRCASCGKRKWLRG
jgi:hypothetical protein